MESIHSLRREKNVGVVICEENGEHSLRREKNVPWRVRPRGDTFTTRLNPRGYQGCVCEWVYPITLAQAKSKRKKKKKRKECST